ncbi:MAG: HAD-IIB family hydrolase [Pseudomonadales bacterium]
MRVSSRPLVFTDLDGTLLDHFSYSFAEAEDLIQDLSSQRIPLIFCSSKTRAEIEPLRTDINNKHPFVVENGAAVFVPRDYFAIKPQGAVLRGKYWVKEFGKTRKHWLGVLQRHKSIYSEQFRSFVDLGAQGIADTCGLSIEQASLANQREYTEPVFWLGSEAVRQAFTNSLIRSGAFVQQGGRFLHLTGAGDKGVALLWLLEQYKRSEPNTAFHTIAMGDSQNDVSMLEVSDSAILIRSPVHDLPLLGRRSELYISDKPGPEGWRVTLQNTLKLLELRHG